MIFDKLNASDEVYGLWQQPVLQRDPGLHRAALSVLISTRIHPVAGIGFQASRDR